MCMHTFDWAVSGCANELHIIFFVLVCLYYVNYLEANERTSASKRVNNKN